MLLLDDLGAIAQLVEQQVEALCVGGSIPPCAIILIIIKEEKKMNKKGINLKDIFDINKIKFTKKELELPYQNYKK